MERFADLLSESIYRIRQCERDKPIGVIQDELGYALGREGGSAIAYWRKGNIPKGADLEKLAYELVKRSDLDRAWLYRFMQSANYPYVDNFVAALFPPNPTQPVLSQTPSAYQQRPLPYNRTGEFITHQIAISKLLDQLTAPFANPILTIDGQGGVGKTAMLAEIAQQAMQRHWFGAIIWIDSALVKVHGLGTLDLAAILWILATQLGVAADANGESTSLRPEQMRQLIDRLCSERLLILLDELETASDSQDLIVHGMQLVLGYSRAVLASRQRFAGDPSAIHLQGMSLAESRQFIRQEARLRGLSEGEYLLPAEEEKLYTITDGLPLALKLIISQLRILPLDAVLQRLSDVNPVTYPPDGDEYAAFYHNVFWSAWVSLSDPARALLTIMADLDEQRSIPFERLQARSNLDDAEFVLALNELWLVSLVAVETSGDIDRKRSYSLRGLTRTFVRSVADLSVQMNLSAYAPSPPALVRN